MTRVDFDIQIERLEDLDDRLSVVQSRLSDPSERIPHEQVVAELGLCDSSSRTGTAPGGASA